MSKPETPRPAESMVYVVDDDDGMRRALGALLGSVGYKTELFARPGEFLAQFQSDTPGCLVLDIRMPEMSGLELQQRLNRAGAMLPVIFITGHGDVPMAVQAMKFDLENRKSLARKTELNRRMETLTPRERQVLDLIVEGEANKVMAIDLGLSERTVEIHRAKVMEKMGARSVAHLVKMHLIINGPPG